MTYLKFVVTYQPSYQKGKYKRKKPYEKVLSYHKGDKKKPKRRHWETPQLIIDAYDVDYKEKYRVFRKKPTPYDKLIEQLGGKHSYNVRKRSLSAEEKEKIRIAAYNKRVKKLENSLVIAEFCSV